MVLTFGEHTWRNTRHIMGWDVKGDGFGVVLSPELPTLMRDNLGQVVKEFLDKSGMSIEEFKGFLFHPGGRKVLETAEAVLGIDRSMIASLVGCAARLRQHVVGDGAIRLAKSDQRR